MKIGMLTGLWYIAEGAPLIESLRRAAELGFRTVDLHGVFHAGPAHLSPEGSQAVKAELAALGLAARNYVLHPLANLPSASEAELERSYAYLCDGVDLALEWGINQLMLNAGQWTYGIPHPQAWDQSVHFLQRLCDYAAPRGVYIAQEPEPYIWFLVNDLASAQRMMADVDRPNFTLLLDLGHMALAREGPETLAGLGEVLIHAHFSDHQPYLHTNQVIGTGFTRTLDYLEALRQLDIDRLVHRFGYDEFTVSFELGVPGERIEDPDDRVRRSLQYIQGIAPFMHIA
jgi:sugar phosphate isomerase/epimerase